MKRIIIVVAMLLATASCSRIPSSYGESIPTGIPSENVNNKMRLALLENYNTYRFGDVVFVDIHNNLDVPIQYNPANDFHIFIRQDNDWIQIDNQMDYSPDQLLPPKALDPLGEGSVYDIVTPNVTEQGNAVDVRIFLVGTICDGNGSPTDEKVSAYVDVTLHP